MPRSVCHDGVQALDSLVNLPYGYETAGQGNFITWGSVGEDLSNDHPISVVYDPTQDVGAFELQTAAEAESGGLELSQQSDRQGGRSGFL